MTETASLLSSDPDTAEEALAQWDAGGTVWTIEMGGIGPGYEQAIHVAAFELLRQAIPLSRPAMDADDSAWRVFGKALDELPHPALDGMGLSGAQYGAALNIVMVTLRHGWKAGIAMADADRRIQVSKDWPRSPDATTK